MTALRILLVDDEEFLRAALAEAMRDDGFDVVEAGSIAEAERFFDLAPCAAVVTDLRLGDGSGIDLLARLRARDSEFLAILASGFGSFESAVEAIRIRVFRFLTKPFSYCELLDVVREGLAASRPRANEKSHCFKALSTGTHELAKRIDSALAQFTLSRETLARAERCVRVALKNAADHAYPMDPGQVTVELTSDSNGVGIIISDTGCGFDLSGALADSLCSSSFTGSGLVQLHETSDEVKIRSTPGKGTEVRLRFVNTSYPTCTVAPTRDEMAVALLWS